MARSDLWGLACDFTRPQPITHSITDCSRTTLDYSGTTISRRSRLNNRGIRYKAIRIFSRHPHYAHLRRYQKYIAMAAASAVTIPAANITTAGLNPLGSPLPVADGPPGAPKSCTPAGMVGGGSSEGRTDDGWPLRLDEVVSLPVSVGVGSGVGVAGCIGVGVGVGVGDGLGVEEGVGTDAGVAVGVGVGVCVWVGAGVRSGNGCPVDHTRA